MRKGKKERGREERRKGITFTWRTSQGQFWIDWSIFLHKILRITIVGRSEGTVIQKKEYIIHLKFNTFGWVLETHRNMRSNSTFNLSANTSQSYHPLKRLKKIESLNHSQRCLKLSVKYLPEQFKKQEDFKMFST